MFEHRLVQTELILKRKRHHIVSNDINCFVHRMDANLFDFAVVKRLLDILGDRWDFYFAFLCFVSFDKVSEVYIFHCQKLNQKQKSHTSRCLNRGYAKFYKLSELG
jgi:hypothetical protein